MTIAYWVGQQWGWSQPHGPPPPSSALQRSHLLDLAALALRQPSLGAAAVPAAVCIVGTVAAMARGGRDIGERGVSGDYIILYYILLLLEIIIWDSMGLGIGIII